LSSGARESRALLYWASAHGAGTAIVDATRRLVRPGDRRLVALFCACIADGKWISYLRVSTARQGRSGLGLETQRKSVEDFLNGGNWRLVKEFVEVESGKNTSRPVLADAIKACRLYGAKLVIAKLDRLSRNAHFLLRLKDAGVDFVCADMPSANRLTVGIMAMVAEEEGRMISARTKAALAAARRRGVQLGGYNKNPRISAKARKAGQETNARKAASRGERRNVTTGPQRA
jgi:DNA invertase Pin-like site-specific DNA recombinase